MAQGNRPWEREEFILVLNLYYKLPFGRLNRTTKEVKELARLLNRSYNSIALRLVNFAACDPYIRETGRHGMMSGMKQCQPYWDEFSNDREKLLFESERILANFQGTTVEQKYNITQQDLADFVGEDIIREVATRVNQSVFREKVLSNYEYKCALTGIDIKPLLVASHIIPWSKNKEERLNPSNGICLSTLYDTAFDKGYIGFDRNYKVILSSKLMDNQDKSYYNHYFGCIEGSRLTLPYEFKPDIHFLEWHMDEVFLR